jgi:hypothetical protein
LHNIILLFKKYWYIMKDGIWNSLKPPHGVELASKTSVPMQAR